MDDNNTNSKSLEDIKNIIRTKEDEITKSQIRINNLESKKKKLEKQKRSIRKGWKTRLSGILFYIGYSMVILLLLAAYITPVINVLNTVVAVQKTICIIALYVGVLGITTLGAYITSKIEKILRKRKKLKSIEIANQLETLEKEMVKEESLQELLKKDITVVLDKLDINKEKNILLEENINYYNIKQEQEKYHEKIEKIPYIRKKKR